MKRRGTILFMVFCLLLTPVLGEAAPRVVVDGRIPDFGVAPVVERGTVLVPMRGIFEALGATVDWTPETRTVTAVKGPARIVLQAGSRTAYRNGRPMTLQISPRLYRGHMLVPLRFVGESMGAAVDWDAGRGTVLVNTRPGPAVAPAPVFEGGEVIPRAYTWRYGGQTHVCSFALPADACHYYAGLERVPTNDLSVYVTEPYDDEFISAVAAQLQGMAQKAGYGPRKTVEFVIAFVQSIPYVTDEVSKGAKQYPRYPLETLRDGEGDCEDTGILLASLLQQMEYDAVLLLIEDHPGHVAVGVKGRDLPGAYYQHNGARYYYVETTGTDWRIGDIPPEFRHRPVRVLPLTPQPVIVHQWRCSTAGSRMQLQVSVTNLGTGAAANTRVYAAFDAGDGMVYNQILSDPQELPPRSQATYLLEPDIPTGINTRLMVRILVNGTISDESWSKWLQT